jgi:hypothetical protein
MTTSKTAAIFYSDDLELEARVVIIDSRIFVDFYKKGGKIVESKEVSGHSISYAESMAENYVLGILIINDEKMEL